jgi:hypothetical protein
MIGPPAQPPLGESRHLSQTAAKPGSTCNSLAFYGFCQMSSTFSNTLSVERKAPSIHPWLGVFEDYGVIRGGQKPPP